MVRGTNMNSFMKGSKTLHIEDILRILRHKDMLIY